MAIAGKSINSSSVTDAFLNVTPRQRLALNDMCLDFLTFAGEEPGFDWRSRLCQYQLATRTAVAPEVVPNAAKPVVYCRGGSVDYVYSIDDWTPNPTNSEFRSSPADPNLKLGLASWAFNGIRYGVYDVHYAWLADPNLATSAVLKLRSGTYDNFDRKAVVNQRLAPVGLSDGGIAYQTVFKGVALDGPDAVVSLGISDANGPVQAGIVRLELKQELPPTSIKVPTQEWYVKDTDVLTRWVAIQLRQSTVSDVCAANNITADDVLACLIQVNNT